MSWLCRPSSRSSWTQALPPTKRMLWLLQGACRHGRNIRRFHALDNIMHTMLVARLACGPLEATITLSLIV